MNRNIPIDAASDAIAMAMGVDVSLPHPMARELSLAPLSKIAYAVGASVRPPQSFENDNAVIARGMGTTDFSKALADGSQQLANRRFEARAAHRAFCAEIEVKDFKPESTTSVDVGLALALAGETSEFSVGRVTVGEGNQSVRIFTYGQVLNFSRPLIVNDAVGAIGTMIAGLGGAGARTEAALVCAALEDNIALDDGELVFHVDHGNILAGAFSGSALGQAMALLRKQPTPANNKADLAARHLVVCADLEYIAKLVVHDAGLDLVVTALADLPDGRWYLMADPAVAPTIGYLKLRGSKAGVAIEPAKRTENFDGAAVRVRADLGAAMVGRVGIVRGAP